MHLRVRGGNKHQKALVKLLMPEIVKMLVSKRLANNLSIKVHISPTLRSEENYWATCVWTDNNLKPREFEIEIDGTLKFCNFCTSIVHELIHVKQWSKGEIKEYLRTDKVAWKGREVDQSTNYFQLPWEKEAYKYQSKLLWKWYGQTTPEDKLKLIAIRKQFKLTT